MIECPVEALSRDSCISPEPMLPSASFSSTGNQSHSLAHAGEHSKAEPLLSPILFLSTPPSNHEQKRLCKLMLYFTKGILQPNAYRNSCLYSFPSPLVIQSLFTFFPPLSLSLSLSLSLPSLLSGIRD